LQKKIQNHTPLQPFRIQNGIQTVFPDGLGGEIYICLPHQVKIIKLNFSDNGIGLSEDQGHPPSVSGSMELVKD